MMSGTAPLVSIVTPAYNEEAHIRECIESVQGQTYRNWHYVIVDNCSTDRTAAIAQEYAHRDPRIRVQRNGEFVGAVANHNIAFRQLSPDSRYCKLVAADDVIFPECVEQMVSLAEEHPSVAIVGAYRIAGAQLQDGGLPFPDRHWPGHAVCRAHLLGGRYPFGVPTSTLYRADVVRQRYRFFDETRLHADVMACFDVLRHHGFGFVHDILCYERIRPSSLNARIKRDNLYVYEFLDALLTYGPFYLSGEELQRCIEKRLTGYYDYLASCVYDNTDGEFWRTHKQCLARLGYPLSLVRLITHAGSYAIEAAMRRIRSRLYRAPIRQRDVFLS